MTIQPPTQRKGRIGTLETARFLFIVFIYISHCETSTAKGIFDFGGESGVAFFFVLSGFVLSLGYGQRVEQKTFGERHFLFTRLAHLYPLHLLIMAATIALDYRLGVVYSWGQILCHTFLVQTWTASVYYISAINGVSWFLCDILFFYAVFAPLYRLLMRCGVKKLCMIGVPFVIAYELFVPIVPDDNVNWTIYGYPLLRLIDFSLGVLLYRFFVSERSQRIAERVSQLGMWRATGVEMLAVVALGITWMTYGQLTFGVRCASLFWPCMPFIIYILAVANGGRGLLSRLMQQPLAVRLGSVSFEIFLIHILMMRVTHYVLQLVWDDVDAVVSLVVAFFASVAVAFALQRWLVRPICNAARNVCK